MDARMVDARAPGTIGALLMSFVFAVSNLAGGRITIRPPHYTKGEGFMKKSNIFLITLFIAIVLLISGCSNNSIELIQKGSILENSYFSIDVSGYEDIRIGEEETGNAAVLAYAISPNQNGGREVFINISGGKNGTTPTKDYFEMMANNPEHPRAVSGELISYDVRDDVLTVEIQYQIDDGSIGYYYQTGRMFDDGTIFGLHFYDYRGAEKDEIYTNAIESLTWK